MTEPYTSTLAIYFSDPAEMGYPFSEPEGYLSSYRELAGELLELGVRTVVVRGPESHLGNTKFAGGWDILTDPFTKVGKFEADLIFDRGRHFTDPSLPLFNHPDIHKLCNDKWQTYQAYPEFCPLTIKVSNQADIVAALEKISTDMVVIKPIDDYGGHDVAIISRQEAAEFELTRPEMLLQEFLDMSQGVPGLVTGLHDLRVAVLDGKFSYSYLRTPPEGKLTANLAQGGAFMLLSEDQIPAAMMDMVKKIDADLTNYPHRFYGVDFAYTPDGPKIIELNSFLGLMPNSDGEVFVKLKKNLAKTLRAMINELDS